jgi:hypothetical protein
VRNCRSFLDLPSNAVFCRAFAAADLNEKGRVTVRPVLDRVSGFADLLLEDRDEAFAVFRHAEDIGLPLGAPEFLTGVETIQQTHSRRSVISRLVESDRQMDDKRLDRQVRQVLQKFVVLVPNSSLQTEQ